MAADSLDAFLWAIGQEESGGNYKARNPGGALGKYQIMNFHLAGGNEWAGRVFGHAVSEKDFLNSPSMQETMARQILGGYYQKYGAAGAAAAWFSGSPNVNSNASDGNTTVRKYVANVLSLMGKAPKGGGSGGVGPGSVPGSGVSDGVYRPGGSSGTGTATQAGFGDSSLPPDCLWGVNLSVGSWCILTKGQARAIFGALLIGSGGIVAGAGLIVLAAYGLKATGVLDSVAGAAQVIPGAGGLASKAAGASGKLKAGPKPKGGRDGGQ